METLRIAATALNTHKLRSFLTLLGVIIGVMTIIAVVSVISGLNAYVNEKLIQFNPDTYVITQFGIITSREQFLEAVKRKKLDANDYLAVRDRCTECAAVAAQLSTRGVVKRGSIRSTDVRITGGTANLVEVTTIDLEAGRMFSRSEDEHSGLVVVIGSDVRENLFGKLDPIGRLVWVANQPMRVIGTVAKQGTVLGNNQDNQLYMPLSTFRKQFGTRRSLSFFIKAKGGVAGMQKSMDDVRVIMRARRKTAFRADDPFGLVSAEALQALWKSISAATFAVVALVSSISLVVGGIVIMNIMLVSVVERTREIGIRRALGATKRNIAWQFLSEAVLLSLGGGIVGVLIGALISMTISTATPLPTLVRPQLVITGLGIAVFTGLIAGIIPAVRAAALPPVEALRYE
jgi:putative ABC transport system permease protein